MPPKLLFIFVFFYFLLQFCENHQNEFENFAESNHAIMKRSRGGRGGGYFGGGGRRIGGPLRGGGPWQQYSHPRHWHHHRRHHVRHRQNAANIFANSPQEFYTKIQGLNNLSNEEKIQIGQMRDYLLASSSPEQFFERLPNSVRAKLSAEIGTNLTSSRQGCQRIDAVGNGFRGYRNRRRGRE